MNWIQTLNQELDVWFLLKHSFYRSWNEGKLSKEVLGFYALEYFHHVSAFPRYISQMHALCADLKVRQVLLEHLIEEEKGNDNHPELWLRFIEGVTGARTICQSPQLSSTKELVEGFFFLTRCDYPTGLGALYAYERQTPAVSKSKREGLKMHYGIQDERALKFFSVHESVDQWHTEELERLIDVLSAQDRIKAIEGAKKDAQWLWAFLDGIEQNAGHAQDYC